MNRLIASSRAVAAAFGWVMLLAALPATAQTTTSPNGRLLASNCFQCHGTNGKGPGFATIPKAPYRCPPGPCERACLIADWLKVNKPRAKLIVLAANPDFVTEIDNFSKAFYGLHAKVIEYRPNSVISSVDTRQMVVYASTGAVQANVVNLIPQQRAGALAAGLATANGGRFVPVDVLSYACLDPAATRVHVIGDAAATTQPKAGHIANQEAKVCADALARIFGGGSRVGGLAGRQLRPDEHLVQGLDGGQLILRGSPWPSAQRPALPSGTRSIGRRASGPATALPAAGCQP